MVSLIQVTSTIADISVFSQEGYKFNPKHLDQEGKNLECARETLYAYFKNVAKVSSSNPIQDCYALMKNKRYSTFEFEVGPFLATV